MAKLVVVGFSVIDNGAFSSPFEEYELDFTDGPAETPVFNPATDTFFKIRTDSFCRIEVGSSPQITSKSLSIRPEDGEVLIKATTGNPKVRVALKPEV